MKVGLSNWMVVVVVMAGGVCVASLNFSNNAMHFSLNLGEKQIEIIYVCTYIMYDAYIKIYHV